MNIIKNITLAVLISLPVFTLAQNEDKYGTTDEQRTLCKEALSVYKNYKKQKDYAEAYQQWEKACEICPDGVQESLYADGATLLKAELKVAKQAGDDARQALLVDSLMWVYDMRMELFPATKKKPNNRCHVLGRKASDFAKYFKNEPQAAFEMFAECVECLQGSSSATVLSKYYSTGLKTMVAINKEDKEAGLEMKARLLTDFLMLMDYADQAIAASAGNEKAITNYESAKTTIRSNFNKMADCEDMIPILTSRIEANPNDIDLKIKVLELLRSRDCTDNDIYLPIAKAVYELEPSAAAAYSIGMGLFKKSQYADSFVYMEEAVSNCEGCPEQVKYLLKAGQIASALNRSNTAKRYARQVLAIDPNNADAYMLIGDAIAGSPKACDDGGIGSRAVYWVAHDYYSKAKSLNPEKADIANKKMSNMKKQFPTIDDVFALGLTVGSKFTVKESGACPCSGETTIIRVR